MTTSDQFIALAAKNTCNYHMMYIYVFVLDIIARQ